MSAEFKEKIRSIQLSTGAASSRTSNAHQAEKAKGRIDDLTRDSRQEERRREREALSNFGGMPKEWFEAESGNGPAV